MTPARLRSLAAYAGDRIYPNGPSGPHPFRPETTPNVRRAVYIVCAWSGRIVYVGSTTVGLRARFAQHLSDRAKTLDWTTVYVVPLNDDTPSQDVRRIEGRIGLAVGPERNRALPRIF